MNRSTFLKRAGLGAALVAGAGIGGAGDPRRASAARKPSLAALARVTQGRLITPGSSRYNVARQVVNARFSGARPLAVLQARNAQDVRQAVLWCARNGVRITARSGGHSYAGYSTLNGGLVVDLSALNGIRLSSDRRTVQAGAGGDLINFYTALARRGLTVPGGSCPTVGLGGLALGGGVGMASRALGTTSDNIVAMTVVTADGQVRSCDRRTNPDLFWACRGGGGGNFGITTGFTFSTHRVRSASYFFANFAWKDAHEVVAAWQRWAPHAPPELFSICSLATGPGGPIVNVFGQYMGTSGALRRTLARGLTSAVAPASIEVGTSPYLSLVQRWAGLFFTSPLPLSSLQPRFPSSSFIYYFLLSILFCLFFVFILSSFFYFFSICIFVFYFLFLLIFFFFFFFFFFFQPKAAFQVFSFPLGSEILFRDR